MRRWIMPVIALVIVIAAVLVSAATGLLGRWFGNRVDYAGYRIDERTRYENLKLVEDTARAMRASYTADKMTYEQYRDSESTEQQGWAAQAKMRANRTAATYNEYILANSFVWADNVPDDIAYELEYIE